MSASIDRFRERLSGRISVRCGESWTHTNGDGVSRVYQAIYQSPFEAVGGGAVSVEDAAPAIMVLTEHLSGHEVGDTWTNSQNVAYEALTSEESPRTGFTKITLRLP